MPPFLHLFSRFYMCRVRIIAPLGYTLNVCVRYLIIAPVRSVGAAHTKQPSLISQEGAIGPFFEGDMPLRIIRPHIIVGVLLSLNITHTVHYIYFEPTN
jgi:hypothetical protein